MSQNITLMGASYSAVPAVTLPKTGGGTATFTDVTDTTAAASDVASGKYFYTSSGVRTAGTSSGGGGSGMTLLGSKSLGAISTSSTTATDTGQTLEVEGINDYDALVTVISVDSIVNNRHVATIQYIWLTGTSNISTKNTATIATATWNEKRNSSGTASTRANTTKYGIYVNTASTPSGGKTTLAFYQRYNSTQTGTINGSYTARIYGLTVNDLIGG